MSDAFSPSFTCRIDMRRDLNYVKIELIFNLPDNEVYYAACSLPVILQNLCSKLHCQKGFNSIIFLYKYQYWR